MTARSHSRTLLLFLAVLVAVALLARRLNTAPSILLVIAGIALALVPGLPVIELAPEAWMTASRARRQARGCAST